MRKIREVLRLKFDAGLSVRKIAASLSIGHSSAGDYLCRFAASGLQWPIDISDAELNRRLFPPAVPVPTDQRPMPDWAWVHAELRRPGVTLALLWQEYRLAHPQGFQYSWFCEHYRLWTAKVEVGVQVVERWILAVLRNRQFFSLGELNTAIALLLDRLNHKPFKKLPGSRRSAFEAIDQPALEGLPEHPYVYAEWKKVRVHIDYHVEVDGHFYSVPYQLVKHQVEVRLTAQTVECFHANQRVASHLRSQHKGRHTTQTEHMPKSHREHAEWTPQRLIRWAEQTGPNTAGVITYILERRIHPQHGFRACLGILRLSKQHGEARLEAACQRALALGACSYKSLESILRQGLERLPLAQQNLPLLPDEHINLRGPGYYH
ncbi:Mu transposase domain-containing protein [Pseudomonas savastanoi]